MELFRLLGDGWGSTWALHLLGLIEIDLENYVTALSIFQESLRLCLASGDQGGVAFVFGQLGRIATLQKDYRNSWKHLIHAAQIGYQSNRPLDIFWYLIGLAHSFHAAGLNERAAELLAFVAVYPGFHWDREYIQRLLKEIESELAPAVFTRARQRGEAQHLKGLIDSLEAEFASQPGSELEPASVSEYEPGRIEELIEPLSERELETLGYLAAGLSNREIANKMSVTVGTVKKHLNNIFGKLQVSSRTQAIARAQALKLLAKRA